MRISIQALLTPLCAWSVTQSCPALFDSMDCSLPGSSVHGILQSRILECVAISCSRGSSQPSNWTQVSYFLHWQTDSLSLHHLRSPFDSFNGAFWWAEIPFCCCYFSVIFYYTIPLYWKGPFFLTKHLNLGVLFVSLLSLPQVCLRNQVSMEPCTGERGKAKQNKIQNWPREPGNCTLPWFVWEIIKNQKPMATL